MAHAPFTLTTARLRLDQMQIDDWPIVQAEWGVPEVARMTASFRTDWTEQTAKAWIGDRLAPDANGFGCAIRLSQSNRLIGSVGIGGDPLNLGYALAQPFWGVGYATEAVLAFLDACYQTDAQLDVVEASVFDDNPGSARVLEKAGFHRAGKADCSSLARDCDAPSSRYLVTRSGFGTIIGGLGNG